MPNARFMELLRCHGVDQTASPHVSMVVPFGGENQIVLETSGVPLELQKGALRVDEYNGDLTTNMLVGIQQELSKPGVDPQEKDAYMPFTGWRQPRFFRVLGTMKTGFPGAVVQVVPPMARGRRPAPAAKLQVAVVDKMVVKVAIRNVRARDQQGTMRYHARRPCHPVDEVAAMNAIWRPQTNIIFELVPSTDVEVDHNDPTTRRELTAAYGMSSPATFLAETKVWSEKNSGWFAKHKVPGTHITFFHVHLIHSGGDPVYGKGGRSPQGTMNRELGVSFISETRLPSTFAHEAGHYIGDMDHKGEDINLLMRAGGSGFRIPFDLARHFRTELLKRKAK